MGHVDLQVDGRTGLFVVPGFIVRPPTAPPAPDGNPYVTVEFIMDTGSNQTSISERVAEELGIDLDHLERGHAGGIGGFSSPPLLKNFEFWIPEAGGPVPVRLAEISVVEDKSESRIVRKQGGKKERTRKLSGISLLGLDTLTALKATLTVVPYLDTAHLDW